MNSIKKNEIFKKRPRQVEQDEWILCATDAYYKYKYVTTIKFLAEIAEFKKLTSKMTMSEYSELQNCDPDDPEPVLLAI